MNQRRKMFTLSDLSFEMCIQVLYESKHAKIVIGTYFDMRE